ncbi:hypothetical protein OC835_007712 [Tilletia horrida]|nr:hypothetical protein OC835_007712 [Tilletia horrida]
MVDDDQEVDAVAFVIAYILALVERYAPEELDNGLDDRYREGKLRSHLERLYIIAPFWERFLLGVRSLYRWEQPRRTGTAAPDGAPFHSRRRLGPSPLLGPWAPASSLPPPYGLMAELVARSSVPQASEFN